MKKRFSTDKRQIERYVLPLNYLWVVYHTQQFILMPSVFYFERALCLPGLSCSCHRTYRSVNKLPYVVCYKYCQIVYWNWISSVERYGCIFEIISSWIAQYYHFSVGGCNQYSYMRRFSWQGSPIRCIVW